MLTMATYEAKVEELAIYPGVNSGSKEGISYVALGLCGESGEFAEKVKKWLRDGTFDKELMAKELGDILWYLTRASHELGYDLETIAAMNLEKLSSRKDRGVMKGSGDTR